MAIMGDYKGTSQATFQFGKGGAKIRTSAGNLEARNAANSAYVSFLAETFLANGDTLTFNQNATLSGASWKMSLKRPSTGMTANVDYTFPAAPDAGKFLQTDALGNLTWATAATGAGSVLTDSTDFAFNSAGTIALFTLPANAVVLSVKIFVDTAFDDSPSISVGITGTPAKYMATTDVDLTSGSGDRWESNPNNVPVGTTEALIATYNAGTSTVGAGRIMVEYTIPN